MSSDDCFAPKIDMALPQTTKVKSVLLSLILLVDTTGDNNESTIVKGVPRREAHHHQKSVAHIFLRLPLRGAHSLRRFRE